MTHADIAWIAEVLEVDDSRWCHRAVDTDCLLTVLVEESFKAGPGREALADAFERLSIDREVLRGELRRVRPAEHTPMFPSGGRSETGGWADDRVPSARLTYVGYRVREKASRAAQPAAQSQVVNHLDILHGLLGENDGPAAEALLAAGVAPSEARRVLEIDDPRPAHILPALWPPPRLPREFSWPEGTNPRLVLAEAPPPSPKADPNSFVWTSEGQELELSASRNGPIALRAKADGEVTIEICAEAAELIQRILMNLRAQVDIERWEPVFEAEKRGEAKPPPP